MKIKRKWIIALMLQPNNDDDVSGSDELNDDNWMERVTTDEARAQAEIDARIAATPLRRVIGMKWNETRPSDTSGDFWELECGHRVSRRQPLDDKSCVRCQICFVMGMKRAEKMLGRG